MSVEEERKPAGIEGSIELSANALAVLRKRYLKKDESGEPLEEPIDMFRRVAANIAGAEAIFTFDGKNPANNVVEYWQGRFLDLMLGRKFMPNSPTLMNAGRELQQLSACFVLPVEDSIDGIYDTLKHQAVIHKSGGGTGFGFSRLRPKNDLVKSTMGVSSGPVSFMAIYDASTDKIKQGGTRRGANMGILRCLSGDTLLSTLAGRKRIKELVGTRPYLYACDPATRRVHVVQADEVFVSDRRREMVRVRFDDDDHLDCTPDHRFMLADGTYRPAADLALGDRLMAFEKRIVKHGTSERYVRTIGCTGGRAEYEHRVVARDVLGEEVSRDHHAHHRDENPLNNDPGNLQTMSRSGHGSAHAQNLIEHQQRIADQRRGRTLEEVYGTEKARAWRENLSRAKKRSHLANTEDPDTLGSVREEVGDYAIPNHRVVEVEPIGLADAVYDVSLPMLHNFSANGVFVHNCDHPDIEEFVSCKRDNAAVNNFNISVAVTDTFMEAVERDGDFDLVNPRDGKVAETIRARGLFSKIVEGAWLNGEPGVVFIDRINADNPTPQFPIESTNPCSEAHLPPYDSCNLGSINLERFALSATSAAERRAAQNGHRTVPREQETGPCIDWMGLRDAVGDAVRFLDDVVEVNRYPLPEIDEMSRGNRRIGLGVMGFADLLIKLGIPYDSERALTLAEDLMEWIDRHAWEASRALARERGVFPHYEGSTHEAREDPVRNATVTTIAPTGTISMIAECSGGIEPLFAVAFMRRQAGMEMPDVNPEFVRIAKERGFYSEGLMQKVAESGSVRGIEEVPEDVRRVFATAGDISPEFHVRMQAAFQKHTSMGISKTINLPRNATLDDVEDAYRLAYSTGCKGMAVYRDGSRDEQVFSTSNSGGTAPAPVSPKKPPTLAEARDGRPRTLDGVTKKLKTGHGPLYVTMNDDEFGPRECFIVLGKPGGTAAAFSDALGRMTSLAMTHGATPEEIVKQLRGIQDGHPAGVGPNAVLSVPDGVARAMAEHYLLAASGGARPEEPALPVVGACPDCAAELTHEEGCSKCHSCGYSRC